MSMQTYILKYLDKFVYAHFQHTKRFLINQYNVMPYSIAVGLVFTLIRREGNNIRYIYVPMK